MKEKRVLPIVLFLILFCLPLQNVFSQTGNARITMEFHDEALPSVFKRLEKISKYRVLFTYDDINSYTATGAVKDATIEQTLSAIIGDKPLKYNIHKEFINITPQKDNRIATVNGRVISAENGDPIAGAFVSVEGTTVGTTTDSDGAFVLSDIAADAYIRISFLGMETQRRQVSPQMKIFMEANELSLKDVVVTGYYTAKKTSFTGVATNYSGEELRSISDKNVLSTIAALDPSFQLVDNIAMGSDPNTIPDIQIRGVNSLPNTDVNLSEEYKGSANLPTFILDGFEVSIEKIYDLDPNRISNISILKDASATAIYGSRAANGVVVIDTKAPLSGKLRLNYYGSVDMEVADLSKYNLLNAAEKLQYEALAGLYDGSDAVYVQEEYLQRYNERLKLVEKGVNTDWLAKPLKSAGISNKHTFQIEGGNENFRYGVNLNYSNTSGVMKGSGRKRIGTSVKLQYNYKNLRFRNEVSYDNVTSKDSPYGTFNDYALMNPYYYPYDENGKLKRIVFENYTPTAGNQQIANPMYNSTLNVIDKAVYDDFIDNFNVEWNILSSLKLKGNFSIERITKNNDVFKPADHTDFIGDTENKGSYMKGNSVSTSYDGNIVLSYFDTFGKHALGINGGWNIQATSSDYNAYTVYGFPNQALDHPSLGSGFLDGETVAGNATITRLMGFFANANYSYDDRYFVDASLRSDGSSLYGSNQRWGTFWSSGVGWNIHNEKFLKNNDFVNQLRIRVSTGFTGNQNFYPYQALMMYEYKSSLAYQDYIGTIVKAFGNSDLKWQRTFKTNFGTDFAFFRNRITGYFNYFIENSKDLLVDVTMANYLGFDSYKENLGETQNKGFDFNLKVTAYQDKQWRVNLFWNGQHYVNKLKKISSGLNAYNTQADAQSGNRPYVRFAEGTSINSIWVVPSAGIDPATGNEVFIDRNGNYVTEWSEKDYVPYKSTDPKVNGTFGLNVFYRGWELNANFYYSVGGYAYNQTLVDKVENVNPYLNVDKRALYNRWTTPGVAAEYKRIDDLSMTKPTSRFVEKNNYLSANSLSLAYTFDRNVIKKIRAQYLKLILTANDFLYASTMHREMGTSYPYARHYSLSVQVTF